MSRPVNTNSFAFVAPVSLSRLRAIGKGEAAGKITAELARLEAKAAATRTKYAPLLQPGVFEQLLAWAVRKAAALGIVPPYKRIAGAIAAQRIVRGFLVRSRMRG